MGFHVVFSVFDGLGGVELAFFGFGSDKVKTWEGTAKILEGLIEFFDSHKEWKDVEVSDVIEMVELNGKVKIGEGFFDVAQLAVEKGPVRVQDRIAGVFGDAVVDNKKALFVLHWVEHLSGFLKWNTVLEHS